MMEVFGFIVSVMILVAASCAWVFVFIFDGAFGGKRDIPVYVMFVAMGLIIWGSL